MAGAELRAGAGEAGRDRAADPGARSGDDSAQAGERLLSGLRGQWLGYPSEPPANGWRAFGVSASTWSTLGSLFKARAIDSFTAS